MGPHHGETLEVLVGPHVEHQKLLGVAELIEHHRTRANEVISILERGPRNGYDTAARMSWDIVAPSWNDFPIMQRWFATGEAVAHLRYLEVKGLVQRQLIDGQSLYSTNGKARL